jgi:hypothetical protein
VCVCVCACVRGGGVCLGTYEMDAFGKRRWHECKILSGSMEINLTYNVGLELWLEILIFGKNGKIILQEWNFFSYTNKIKMIEIWIFFGKVRFFS